MTADTTGRPATGVWTTLRRIREQWVLVAAVASALFWARDQAVIFAELPGEVARQGHAIARIAERIEEIGTATTALARLPAKSGTGPGVQPIRLLAAPAGGWTALYWRASGPIGVRCTPRALSAEMVDSRGRWYAADTDLRAPPEHAGGPDTAYGVRVHRKMAVGPAVFRARITRICADVPEVVMTPWLAFEVLAPKAAPSVE